MKALRDLIDQARRQAEAARAQAADRPTSLYGAGSVGDRVRAVVHQEPEAFVDVAPPRPREFAVPQVETEHVEDRPRRAPGPSSRRPATRRESLRATLRTPAALRRAIVVNEVLGPPVALRDEHW